MNKKVAVVIVIIIVVGIFYLSRQSNKAQEVATDLSIDAMKKVSDSPSEGFGRYAETKTAVVSSHSKAAQQSGGSTSQNSTPPPSPQNQASNENNSASGAPSSERKLMVVDVNARLQHQYAFDQEQRDEAWAGPTEQSIKDALLNNQYASRYNVEELGCKTTVCVIKVTVDMNKTTPQMEQDFGWSNIVKSLRNSPLSQNIQDAEIAVSSDPKKPSVIVYETSFLKQ